MNSLNSTFRSILFLLLTVASFTGCSMLTQNGRNQAAYARYVSKSSQGRVKQQRLFHSNKPAMPVTTPEAEPNEPVESESSGPQAVAENVP